MKRQLSILFVTLFSISLLSAESRLIFPDLRQGGGVEVAFAILNSRGEDTQITATAFNPDGSLLAGPGITNPAVLDLAGKAQLARFGREIFGFADGEVVDGWMEVTSEADGIKGFFLTLEEVPRWWKVLLNRATKLPPAVKYRPGLSFKYRAPLSVLVALFLVWNAHTRIWGYIEQSADDAEWAPQLGVWTFDDRDVAFPADSSRRELKWNRLIIAQPDGYMLKFDDEMVSRSDVNRFDSLGTFVFQFQDSTDRYIGRYEFDADTLSLRGIQFGDSLSLKLIKRSFRLEPESRYPFWGKPAYARE